MNDVTEGSHEGQSESKTRCIDFDVARFYLRAVEMVATPGRASADEREPSVASKRLEGTCDAGRTIAPPGGLSRVLPRIGREPFNLSPEEMEDEWKANQS
jgi:hypothetical protein